MAKTGRRWGDLWSLKSVFAAVLGADGGPVSADDEFVEDDVPDEEQGSPYRLCDEARAAIADACQATSHGSCSMVCHADGFPADHLSSRFTGTCWEPLLWAAPWLWRTSGNPFLDRDGDDYPEPEPWSASGVFCLTAQYREALRIMRAVDGFDSWLLHAPAERARAAVQAAMGRALESHLNSARSAHRRPPAGRHCPLHMAPAP